MTFSVNVLVVLYFNLMHCTIVNDGFCNVVNYRFLAQREILFLFFGNNMLHSCVSNTRTFNITKVLSNIHRYIYKTLENRKCTGRSCWLQKYNSRVEERGGAKFYKIYHAVCILFFFICLHTISISFE